VTVRTIVLSLPVHLADEIDTRAGHAGMTPSAWLSDQVEGAFGSGIVTTTRSRRPRPGKQARARRRVRTARAPKAAAETTTTPSTNP
jgi:hypothetical protein